ncbi:MAG: hypothetical protein HON32_10190 [Francisellaceae bacterium]|jgi:S1-C subfamily serine protease|nr:hypothetical protein [Francisellaceae bacterium]
MLKYPVNGEAERDWQSKPINYKENNMEKAEQEDTRNTPKDTNSVASIDRPIGSNGGAGGAGAGSIGASTEIDGDSSTAVALDSVGSNAQNLAAIIGSLPPELRADADFMRDLTMRMLGTDSMASASRNDSAAHNRRMLEGTSHSIVQIVNTSESFNVLNPGKEGDLQKSSGTGVVIDVEKRLILTDDHVAGASKTLSINQGPHSKKYSAKLVYSSEVCDLALVTVDNDEFWESAQALSISDVDAEPGVNVTSIGYPMAGGTICITKGNLSRIEAHGYAHSGVELPIAQITTPTNPGNSGGPGLSDDLQILGITHQGMPGTNSICHMIPPSVISKFMTAYRENVNQFQIFPTLYAKFGRLSNSHARASHGLDEEAHKELGILVTDIAELSCLHGTLAAGDVLIGINGFDVTTKSTIKPREGDTTNPKYCSNLLSYVHMLNMGEEVSLDFFRDGELHTETVRLSKAIGDLSALQSRQDKPSFFIENGLVFYEMNTDLAASLGTALILSPPELRARMSKFRSTPDEAIVIILGYFDNTKEEGATYGYPEAPTIINTINGQTIHNLAHLKEVMEAEASTAYHTITSIVEQSSPIIIPRLTALELSEKLTRFGYTKSCSDDLRSTEVIDIAASASSSLVVDEHTLATSNSRVSAQVGAPVLYLSNARQLRTEPLPRDNSYDHSAAATNTYKAGSLRL